MQIGYARVSTADQSLKIQQQALAAAGVDPSRVYADIVSGAVAERPGLRQALSYLREGDTLVVWKLDRLGRSLKHLIEMMQELEQRGIGFRSLTEGFDTASSGGAA